jgi:hypothetical protein
MDSPASNALAHYIHLTLFLLGERLDTAARPTSVAAELYRANHIENYDTCSLRYAARAGGDELNVTVAFTHAAATAVEPVIAIDTDRAVIRYVANRQIEIEPRTGEGKAEQMPLSSNPHHHMLRDYGEWVREGASAALGASLETARQHVLAVNAASEVAPVHEVHPSDIRISAAADGWPLRSIDGVVPAMVACFERGSLLHETGLARWSKPAMSMEINGYDHFRGPHVPDPKVRAATFVTPARPRVLPI